MRKWAIAMAAGALLTTSCAHDSASTAETRITPSQTIKIATWNLEHLAAENGVGCRPRTDGDYDLLRAHALSLGADVIAFQEVENEEAARRVFTADRWSLVMSARPPSGRNSPCREGTVQTIRTQDVGFAIRRGHRFRRNADVRDLGLGDPDLRWGVDVTLLLPRPIRLLGVHLKSGCNAGRDPNDTDCQVLFSQAPIIEAWIDQRAREGQDFAVLGDWNRRTALPADQFVAVVSDRDPPDGELVFTNAGQGARCIARYRDFIDHIAVGRATARRIVPGSFTEYIYGGDERQFPSDHCPSVVAVTSR